MEDCSGPMMEPFCTMILQRVDGKSLLDHWTIDGEVSRLARVDDPRIPAELLTNFRLKTNSGKGAPVSPSYRLVYVTIYSSDVSTRNSCRNLLDLTDFIPY